MNELELSGKLMNAEGLLKELVQRWVPAEFVVGADANQGAGDFVGSDWAPGVL